MVLLKHVGEEGMLSGGQPDPLPCSYGLSHKLPVWGPVFRMGLNITACTDYQHVLVMA